MVKEGDTVKVSTPGESCDGMTGVVYSVGPNTTNVIVDLEDGMHWRFDMKELAVTKTAQQENWWEGIDTSTMDYVEYAAFEDAMTNEEYQQYTNREGE